METSQPVYDRVTGEEIGRLPKTRIQHKYFARDLMRRLIHDIKIQLDNNISTREIFTSLIAKIDQFQDSKFRYVDWSK